MSGLAVQSRNICVVTPPTPDTIDTICGSCNNLCDYEEIALASDGSLLYKKDFSDFLFRKIGTSDTIAIELYKGCDKVADLNSNVLGTFYNGFTAQPDYVGYLVDWSLVFNLFGGGKYQIKAQLSILGVSSTFESRLFRLYKYTPEIAHRTVKIESYQTGNIIASEFDYRDLLPDGWYSSTRIKGTFRKTGYPINTDKYYPTTYVNTQNREQVIPEYALVTEYVPITIGNIIGEQQILANEIFITDYNLNSTFAYRGVPVTPTEISLTPLDSSKGDIYEITFQDRTQNIIKRNV